MFNKLDEKLKRFDELQELIADPKIISNTGLYKKYAKELASLQKLVRKYNEYRKIKKELDSLEVVSNEKHHEEDFMELAREEKGILNERMSK